MKHSLLLSAAIVIALFTSEQAERYQNAERFNDGWSFARVVSGQERKKAAFNLESPDRFQVGDDLIPEPLEASVPVRLPHDWAISGPFDTNPNTWGWQGKLPWYGVGWYSKTWRCDDPAGKTFVLDFGGCMAFPEVYVNGKYAGGWDYGYMSFQVDITPFVQPGDNLIQVRCDTRPHRSRWYPGAGIYRPVQLLTYASPVRFKPGDVTITTPKAGAEEAEVVVKAAVDVSSVKDPGSLKAVVTLKDPSGKIVTEKETVLNAAGAFECTFTVQNPQRWDVDSPNLYTAAVALYKTLEQGASPLDCVSIPFGIREIKWTADDGFHLNGRRVQLYGVDLHHDQGVMGAAAHPTAIERQLKIMKDMGVNAIRTSHNPPSKEFLDACDRLGLIVWNELFDKWDGTAGLMDQSYFDAFMERQVRQFVNRDKNHPSVCIWSIGNEIADIERNSKGGSNPHLDAPRRVKLVADCFRKYDPSRLVAMGCFVDGACRPDNRVLESLDVTGWNYGAKYESARAVYPNMPLVYSESASAVSSRGYYELVPPTSSYPNWRHPTRKDDYNSKTLQVDGYDLISANGPRDIPDVDFDRMERDRYVAGEFVWTGFDYIGEPTPFDRQAKSSYFGIVDLAGIPKDRFYLYRSYWRKDAPTVHILPHWNWSGDVVGDSRPADGKQKIVPVYVYSNADCVELFLNGKSLGLLFKANTLLKPVNLAAAPGCEFSASSEEGKDECEAARAEGQGYASEKAGFKDTRVQSGTDLVGEGKAKGKTNFASKAFDDRTSTRWCATDNSGNQWLQVKLRNVDDPVRSVTVHFENSTDSYSFKIQASDDGENWSDVYGSKFSGTDSSVSVPVSDSLSKSRYFRVWFDETREGRWASICEFNLSSLPPLDIPGYYAVIDKYRFRWENVPYEPGTLEAVAYKFAEPKENERNYIPKSSMFTKDDLYENLKEIGRQTVKTAGAPAAVRLTLEPNPFTGKPGFRSDDDLAYILVESVDKDGTLCPLDNRTIRVTVEGSAELAGICNGDSMGMDSFTDATYPLFYGKAIVAIRSKPGSDPVRVIVESEGVEQGVVTIGN
ncbi:MAG: DUF4982 domain-containing protein [Thermoguttaceae bacterium]|nr:DUF4982 domain-containing protein [Thermoguttaceae bacterium]